MAVDFRGHPMFSTTGCNAPTRFEAERAAHQRLFGVYRNHYIATAVPRGAALHPAIDAIDQHWVA